jgi:hypothetical protein
MVMAETQKSPESVRSAKRLRAQPIRQDSAACVSLSSNHFVKEHPATSDPNARFGFRRPVAKKTKPTPGQTRQASYQTGDCCPLVARHIQWRAREGK